MAVRLFIQSLQHGRHVKPVKQSTSLYWRKDAARHTSSINHLPFWTPGSGHYGKTLGQATRIHADDSIELILPRLDSIPVPSNGSPLTICDYGANDGYSSMNVMRKIIEHFRHKHGEDLAIQVLYEDQEKNDFNSLFRRLQEESSYLHNFTNVYPLASNTSFFKQVVPDNSCDIIYSSNAAHWLPDPAPNMENSVISATGTDEELKIFREASRRYWNDWLLLRAKELKPGGLLIVVSVSAADAFFESCKRPRTRSELTADTPPLTLLEFFLNLEDSWKELRETSVITEKEFKTAFCKFSLRSGREITQPFDDITSPVSRSGLTKMHHDQYHPPCLFKGIWRDKLETEGVDDRQLFADKMAEAFRVWSNSSFRAALADSRSELEKDAILDQLYDAIKRRIIQSDPATFRSEYYISRLIAQKRI